MAKSLEHAEERLIEDLTALQINTIIKPEIIGGSMPSIRFALCDIANRYWLKLVELHNRYHNLLDQQTLKKVDIYKKIMFRNVNEDRSTSGTKGSLVTFHIVMMGARTLYKVLEEKKSSLSDDEISDLYMASRIRENCNRLKLIFSKHEEEFDKLFSALDKTPPQNDEDPNIKSLMEACLSYKSEINYYSKKEIAKEIRQNYQFAHIKVSREDLSAVRKLWEMGTETIALQTSVEIDGDVVTRIQNKYIADKFINLHELHSNSVHISVEFWQSIVAMISKFLGSIFQRLLSR